MSVEADQITSKAAVTSDKPDAGENKDAAPSLLYSWFIVGLLMLAYTLSFIDRQVLSLLIGPLKADLGLSDIQISLLQGVAFALFYTMMGIPCGRLVDKYSRKWIITAGISLWSIMTLMCGLAGSYVQLFLARMGVGIGEATLNPSAYSSISDYFPKEKLGKALGVYAVGIYIGAGLAFILGGSVIGMVEAKFGDTIPITETIELKPWQAIFVIVGIPGFLIALAFAVLMKEPKRTGTLKYTGDEAKQTSFMDGLRFIGQHKGTFIPLYLGISMISPLGYIILAWGPEFFIRTYGLTQYKTGIVFGLIVLVFGSLGIVQGGMVADMMMRRGIKEAYFKVVSIASLLLIPFVLAMPLAGSETVSFIMLAPIIYFSAMPYSCLPAALQVITPNQMRGQVSSIYMLIANMTGIAIGPLVVALLTDKLFQDEQALKYSIAITCAVAAPLSAIFFRMGYKGLRESVNRAQSGFD